MLEEDLFWQIIENSLLDANNLQDQEKALAQELEDLTALVAFLPTSFLLFPFIAIVFICYYLLCHLLNWSAKVNLFSLLTKQMFKNLMIMF